MSIATVKTCNTTTCSFNDNTACGAVGITVGGENAASCTTFVQLDVRRPVTSGTSAVGACKRLECTFNDNLLCTAASIEVRDDATCATYTVA